jgi:flagellar L-ring protein precursor FlgH
MRGLAALLLLLLAGCDATLDRLGDMGGPPRMTPSADPTKDPKYKPMSLPMPAAAPAAAEANSLWHVGARAFFKDQRAAQVGDLITIVVNMTDSADVENASTATGTGSNTMGTPNLFGLEAKIPKILSGSTASALVSTNGANSWTGDGVIKRNETVTLRLAGVVTQRLPNGNLVVTARQEFRVNSELRELTVSGVARPEDIASDNTITHDRLAEARIVYGGRGQNTDVQNPRWGQQLFDLLLPF